MIHPPEFITDRLILRGVTEKDIPAYEKHFIDYEVIRHLASSVPWPYPENGVSVFVKEKILPKQGNDKWVWGIFLKTQPEELIGVVDLWRPGIPENRGFWLGRKFWGQGIMTEAVIPVMNFAFEVLGFETLIFSNAKGNLRSRRIKEKTGATLIRVEPDKCVDPVYQEKEIWELTRQAWYENQLRNQD